MTDCPEGIFALITWVVIGVLLVSGFFIGRTLFRSPDYDWGKAITPFLVAVASFLALVSLLVAREIIC